MGTYRTIYPGPCFFLLNNTLVRSPLSPKSNFLLCSLDFSLFSRLSMFNWNSYWYVWRFQAVVRNTERLLVHFAQFIQMTFYKNINQDIDINRIHQAYSDFSSYNGSSVFVCVCVCVLYLMLYFIFSCVGLCLSQKLKYWIVPTTERPLLLLFYNHTHFPPAASSPVLNFWQPLICPSFLKFCRYKNAIEIESCIV